MKPIIRDAGVYSEFVLLANITVLIERVISDLLFLYNYEHVEFGILQKCENPHY